jgi:hypothetical protein
LLSASASRGEAWSSHTRWKAVSVSLLYSDQMASLGVEMAAGLVASAWNMPI